MTSDNSKVVALRVQQATPPGLAAYRSLTVAADPPELRASPAHGRIAMSLCALCLAALIFSWFAKLDIYAVAEGRIQPIGRSKVVQPLATGRVTAIHVENGTQVHGGELLLELDPTENAADRETSARRLQDLSAEISRRRTAIDVARSGGLDAAPQIEFDSSVDARTQARERGVLVADLSNLRSNLKSLDGRILESSAQRQALEATIVEQEHLVAILKKRLSMHQTLLEKGADSQAAVIDAEQVFDTEVTNLANQKGSLLRAEAAIQSATADKQNSLTKFIADNSVAQAAAQSEREMAAQSLVKSSIRLDYTRLVAPTSGVVQELTVTTVGQVVVTGEHLMTIVPKNAPLEAEASVSNQDIGFVATGQKAIVKLDAFPYTLYGTLSGKITRISHDAVDSRGLLATVNGLPATTVGPPSSEQTRNLVFPVTIALDASTIVADGKRIPLLPGMTATIEIRTGQRPVLQYLLSPMIKVVSEAGHER